MTGLAFVLASSQVAPADADPAAASVSSTLERNTTAPTTATSMATPSTTTPSSAATPTAPSTSSSTAPRRVLTDDERFVDALAVVFLGRPAGDDELAGATEGLDDGQRALLARVAAEDSSWALERALRHYGSAAAFDAAGSPAAFVDQLYQHVFDRAGDDAGIEFWTARLADGVPADQVAAAFAAGEEARIARVHAVFADVLGRAPDAAGEAFWTEQLVEIDELEMEIQLAAGDEFYDRAANGGNQ